LEKTCLADVEDLDEWEFAFEDGYIRKALYATCIKNTSFIAWLSERIFREIFQIKGDFEIEVQKQVI